ncbi:IclR family transcriptional regulator domain-containing protein [Bosea psychrotolerans]|uniref:Transcriptional regulator n=1 Tax=Bosea psychrotolerans TaxID=1871628 RepID=A0A2S4LWQ7_9HYPH|nr:transcriptional regulator [Bosea psychrotolerans]
MNGALVLKTVQGTTPIAIDARAGSELSMHASAQGYVALAFVPRSHRERILRQPLVALTPHSITEPSKLEGNRGFALPGLGNGHAIQSVPSPSAKRRSAAGSVMWMER